MTAHDGVPRAFLSYASADRECLDGLVASLLPLLRARRLLIWYPDDTSSPSLIANQLRTMDLFVPLLSDHYRQSATCQDHLEEAIVQHTDIDCAVTIIPVFVMAPHDASETSDISWPLVKDLSTYGVIWYEPGHGMSAFRSAIERWLETHASNATV
jgi:TIR domain-containing protein